MKIGKVELTLIGARVAGERCDVAALQSGAETLMSHTKLKFDSNDFGPNGEPGPEFGKNYNDTKIECFFDGSPDLVLNGVAEVLSPGTHFSVANMGEWRNRKDSQADVQEGDGIPPFGYKFVVKYLGAAGGGHTAKVRTIHSGVTSNEVIFPKAD